MLQHYDKSNYS